MAIDFTKICRLCLKSDSDLIGIFTNDENCSLSARIMTCSAVEVDEKDALPKSICTECRYELEKLYLFRKKSRNADTKLRMHLRLVNAGKVSHVFEEADDNNEEYEQSLAFLAKWEKDRVIKHAAQFDDKNECSKRQLNLEIRKCDYVIPQWEAVKQLENFGPDQLQEPAVEVDCGFQDFSSENEPCVYDQIIMKMVPTELEKERKTDPTAQLDDNYEQLNRQLNAEIQKLDSEKQKQLAKLQEPPFEMDSSFLEFYVENVPSVYDELIMEIVSFEPENERVTTLPAQFDDKYEHLNLQLNAEIQESDSEKQQQLETVKYMETVKYSEPVEYLEPVEHLESVEHLEPAEHLQSAEHFEPVEQFKPMEHLEPVEYLKNVTRENERKFQKVPDQSQEQPFEDCDFQKISMENVPSLYDKLIVETVSTDTDPELDEYLHPTKFVGLEPADIYENYEVIEESNDYSSIIDKQGELKKADVVRLEKAHSAVNAHDDKISIFSSEGEVEAVTQCMDKENYTNTEYLDIDDEDDAKYGYSIQMEHSHMTEDIGNTGDMPDGKGFKCKVIKKSKSIAMTKSTENSAETNKNKGHSCVDCSKWFASGSALLRHSRIHTGEKPFGCEICGKGFAQKEMLKRHLAIHNSNQLKCKFCKRLLSSRSAMNIHVAKLHVSNVKIESETFDIGVRRLK